MDPIAKAYSTWIQRKITEEKRGKWHSHSFGAIPKRGTSQALVKVMSTIELLRARKRSYFVFNEDAQKAFDRINRKKH